MNKNNNKGFTMVELVVAVAVLGVLMLIALPTVRMIQINNKNSKYRAYEKSVASSSKLYVDSYGEDLFGKEHTGCAIIFYKDLKERDLVEDIQIKNNDCSKDDTYIIVKRTRNKNDHFFPHLTCRENNKIIYGDELPPSLGDDCRIEDGKGPLIFVKDTSSYASNPYYKKGQNPKIDAKIKDAGVGLKANQILNYQWYKNGTKVGNEKKLEFKNADFDLDAKLTIPNIDNMSQVTEDTTYKVVITGTVEDYDGNQTEANFTITIKYHNTSVLIKIHANQGKLTESYDHNYSISNSGFITYKGSEVLQKIWYGESKELLKVDNPGHINLTRQYYIIPKGKEFNTKPDGSGENFSSSGTHNASKFCNASNDDCPSVLYVNWEYGNYTLTYDNNGGSGCTSKTGLIGQSWGTLCTPTKKGYDFIEWRAKNTNTVVTKDTKVSGNLTVVAQWKPSIYTLTYNCPDGSTCPKKTAEFNSTWGTLCTPTRTGYTFAGWYDGTNSVTATTQVNGPRTVSCKWKVNSYTLKYNDNGGTGCSNNPIKRDHGQEWGTLCTPKRTGYKFTGWTGLKSKTAVQNENLTASWTAETYKLTYNCKFGNCTYKNGLYNNTWGTLCTPTRTGYTFKSWSDSAGTVTASTKVTGNRTVTCNWKAKTYTLTYNNAGGSGCSSKTGTYDQPWGTLCTPSKSCYKFTGWYDNSARITENTKVTGNRTAQANWSVVKYTLTYDSNGGSSCTAKTANCGSTWGTLCTPTRTGYKFNGWYSGSTHITSSSKVSGNIKVKAAWTSNTKKVTVTFKTNGASSIGAETKTCSYDSTKAKSCQVTTPTITRKNWTIIGWGTSAGSKTSSVGVGKKATVSSNTTYYAVTSAKTSATFSVKQSAHQNINKLANASRDQTLSCTRYNTATTCNVTSPKISFGTTNNSKKVKMATYFTCKWGSVTAGGSFAISPGKTYTVTCTGNKQTVKGLPPSGSTNVVVRKDDEDLVYTYGVSTKTMMGSFHNHATFKWDGKWIIDKSDNFLWFHGKTGAKATKCKKVATSKTCKTYAGDSILTGWISARLTYPS